MKALRFIIIVQILTATLSVNAQNAFFDKYSEKEHTSFVYISKAMMNMASRSNMLNSAIKKIAPKLDGIYVISTINGTLVREMRSDFKRFIKQNRYEILLQHKEMNSSKTIYIIQGNENIIKELLMETYDIPELKYTLIKGKMTLKEIQGITAPHYSGYNIFINDGTNQIELTADNGYKETSGKTSIDRH